MSTAGITRIAHLSPKDRRRSCADAHFPVLASTTTPAASPNAVIALDASSSDRNGTLKTLPVLSLSGVSRSHLAHSGAIGSNLSVFPFSSDAGTLNMGYLPLKSTGRQSGEQASHDKDNASESRSPESQSPVVKNRNGIESHAASIRSYSASVIGLPFMSFCPLALFGALMRGHSLSSPCSTAHFSAA